MPPLQRNNTVVSDLNKTTTIGIIDTNPDSVPSLRRRKLGTVSTIDNIIMTAISTNSTSSLTGRRSSKNLDATSSLHLASSIQKATLRRRGSNASSTAGKKLRILDHSKNFLEKEKGTELMEYLHYSGAVELGA